MHWILQHERFNFDKDAPLTHKNKEKTNEKQKKEQFQIEIMHSWAQSLTYCVQHWDIFMPLQYSLYPLNNSLITGDVVVDRYAYYNAANDKGPVP